MASFDMDKYFRVEVLAKTCNPQQLIYADMHQCYSEEFVADSDLPDESESGERIVKHLLAGGRGHFGPLENPQITFNAGYFPHSTMQQVRTHRVGVHFSVQSGRYTGKRIIDVVTGDRDVEEVFYLRPVGSYSDRQGKKYDYTSEQRQEDIECCLQACHRYKQRIDQGFAEEHARGLIPFDVRQHWVMSFNVRSLMHLLDLRAKGDAQLECQELCELILPRFMAWCPQVAGWYITNRWKKARLAP